MTVFTLNQHAAQWLDFSLWSLACSRQTEYFSCCFLKECSGLGVWHSSILLRKFVGQCLMNNCYFQHLYHIEDILLLHLFSLMLLLFNPVTVSYIPKNVSLIVIYKPTVHACWALQSTEFWKSLYCILYITIQGLLLMPAPNPERPHKLVHDDPSSWLRASHKLCVVDKAQLQSFTIQVNLYKAITWMVNTVGLLTTRHKIDR